MQYFQVIFGRKTEITRQQAWETLDKAGWSWESFKRLENKASEFGAEGARYDYVGSKIVIEM